jgi:hypothetical protein
MVKELKLNWLSYRINPCDDLRFSEDVELLRKFRIQEFNPKLKCGIL